MSTKNTGVKNAKSGWTLEIGEDKTATMSYYLTEIKSNNYVCLTLTTQALYTGCAKLVETDSKDQENVLIQLTKTLRDVKFQLIGSEAVQYDGKDLRLVLQVNLENDSDRLMYKDACQIITDNKGNRVGCSYLVTFEDSGDADFNDFCFNINSWNKKG